MNTGTEGRGPLRLLISIDFSDCCRLALRKVLDLIANRKAEIIALHVIDQQFVQQCVKTGLLDESVIKKKLFIDAKTKLKTLIDEELPNTLVKSVVCEGVPYMEINLKAEEFDADIIVIGSRGMIGDHENIFFGSTAEKIMRFTKRPVFCVPPTMRPIGPSSA